MPRKTTPREPSKRFLVVNMDCHNVESIHHTMEAALDTVAENVGNNGQCWDADDIYVMEVIAIHAITATRVEAVSAPIDAIDYDL